VLAGDQDQDHAEPERPVRLQLERVLDQPVLPGEQRFAEDVPAELRALVAEGRLPGQPPRRRGEQPRLRPAEQRGAGRAGHHRSHLPYRQWLAPAGWRPTPPGRPTDADRGLSTVPGRRRSPPRTAPGGSPRQSPPDADPAERSCAAPAAAAGRQRCGGLSHRISYATVRNPDDNYPRYAARCGERER